MNDLQNYLQQQFQNPDFRKAYEALSTDHEPIRTIIRSWDPDFTKTTPSEARAIDRSAMEMASGDFLTDSDINWN